MTGPRPMATRQTSADAVAVSPASYVTSTRSPRSLTSLTVAPAEVRMPRRRKALASCFEISSSSRGAILGSASITRDLGAERPVHRGELEPDRSRPDHDGRLGDEGQPERLIARDHPIGETDVGKQPRPGPGREDDVRGTQATPIHLDRGGGGGIAIFGRDEASRAADHLDATMLEQAGEPRDELVDHLGLERQDAGPIGRSGRVDAPFARSARRRPSRRPTGGAPSSGCTLAADTFRRAARRAPRRPRACRARPLEGRRNSPPFPSR